MIQSRKYYEKRTAEMQRLYDEEGWTLQKIGDKFEITRERVRQCIKTRGRNYTSEFRRRKIRSFANQSKTDAELAEEYGIGRRRVTNIRKGIPRAGLIGSKNLDRYETLQKVQKKLEDVGVSSEITLSYHSRTQHHNIETEYGQKILVLFRKSRNTQGKNPLYQFIKYNKVADWYICVTDDTEDMFVIPDYEVKEGQQSIGFTWPSAYRPNGGYRQYHEKFDLIASDEIHSATEGVGDY